MADDVEQGRLRGGGGGMWWEERRKEVGDDVKEEA